LNGTARGGRGAAVGVAAAAAAVVVVVVVVVVVTAVVVVAAAATTLVATATTATTIPYGGARTVGRARTRVHGRPPRDTAMWVGTVK